jgi:hypothetical protein
MAIPENIPQTHGLCCALIIWKTGIHHVPKWVTVGARTVLCEFGALGLSSSCAMAESSELEAPLVKRRVAEADLIWFKVAAISGT